MEYFLFLIFIFISSCSDSPNLNNPKKITSNTNSNNKEYYYYEDFSNTQNKWEGTRSSYSYECYRRFKNNSLVIAPNIDYCFYLKQIEIDKDKDFEIETKLATMSGESKKFHSFVWGRSKDNHYFGVGLNRLGNYRVYRKASDVYTYAGLRKSDIININTFNTIKIKKSVNDYEIYINNVLVSKMPFEPFYGEYIGYTTASKCIFHVDYLKIKYINDKTSEKLKFADDKLRELRTLKSQIDLKRQKVIDLDIQYKEDIDTLKKEILHIKKINNVSSFNQAQENPRIKSNLMLIGDYNAYVSKYEEIIKSLDASSEEMRVIIIQQEKKIEREEVFNEKELELIISDIEKTVTKYAFKARELDLNIPKNSQNSTESIWKELNN